MANYFERYQQGQQQEVYDELLDLGEQVFEPDIYPDALAVAQIMMRRIRYNLEVVLIPRLKQVGYRFGDGSWDHPDGLSDQDLFQIQQAWPIFQPPSPDATSQLAQLEQ